MKTFIGKSGTGIGKSGTGIGKSGTGIGKSGTGIDTIGSMRSRRRSMIAGCGVLLGLCLTAPALAVDRHTVAWSAEGNEVRISLHVGEELLLGRIDLAETTQGYSTFELFGANLDSLSSHGSGTGTASHGSGTGTASHGSGTGQRSHGSGTGTTSHGSGTGTASHGSGTGQRSHGSGTGTTSHGSGTGTTGHQPGLVPWGYAEVVFDGADIQLIAYRHEGDSKVEAFVAVLEEGKGWELIPTR